MMGKKKTPSDEIKTVADLTAWEENPNEISQANAIGLARSLERFGDVSGITFNLKKKRLVGGHQRVDQIFKRYGPLPIKKIDSDLGKITAPDGKWWSVRFVEWDDDQHVGAAIAANAETITGEFTDDLQTLLLDWQPNNLNDFESLGFDLLLGESLGDENVTTVKVDQPPDLVWVVAAIPVNDFHLISADVESWKQISAFKSLVTSTSTDED